jgi:GTPase
LEQRRRDESADALSPTTSGAETGRAIVIEPWLKYAAARGEAGRAPADARSPEARLDEAAGLARAINLNVVQARLVTLNGTRKSSTAPA